MNHNIKFKYKQKPLCDIIDICEFSIPSCYSGFIDPKTCRFYEKYKLDKINNYDKKGYFK